MLGLGLLGLHELGEFGRHWVLMDVLWATTAAIAIGVAAGSGVAYLVVRLRRNRRDAGLLNDFLGLGLIGVVSGLCVLLSAWGFLAVFFAAVVLRQTELGLAGGAPGLPQQLQTDMLARPMMVRRHTTSVKPHWFSKNTSNDCRNSC